METKTKEERPDFVTDEHLEYLDALRKSGVTNMFGATPYVQKAFKKLKGDQAKKVLLYWMHTFSERHPK
jgi:hypothetical protein